MAVTKELASYEQFLKNYREMNIAHDPYSSPLSGGIGRPDERYRALQELVRQGRITMEQAHEALGIPYKSPPPRYSQEAKPTARKIQMALDRAIEQLPIRLTYKIDVIRFGPDGADPQFEVVFKGGKVVTFDNLDTFPTDADISRICVECP